MAAEVDLISTYTPIIVTVILSAAFSAMFLLNKRLSTSERGTVTGTIKLEHVSGGLDSLEKRTCQRFERIDKIIELKEHERNIALEKMNDRIDEVKSDVRVHGYRIDDNKSRIERLERNGRGNGFHKAAVS